MDKRWSLQGMTALVTGGAAGIGFVLLSLYHVCNRRFFFCQNFKELEFVECLGMP